MCLKNCTATVPFDFYAHHRELTPTCNLFSRAPDLRHIMFTVAPSSSTAQTRCEHFGKAFVRTHTHNVQTLPKRVAIWSAQPECDQNKTNLARFSCVCMWTAF